MDSHPYHAASVMSQDPAQALPQTIPMHLLEQQQQQQQQQRQHHHHHHQHHHHHHQQQQQQQHQQPQLPDQHHYSQPIAVRHTPPVLQHHDQVQLQRVASNGQQDELSPMSMPMPNPLPPNAALQQHSQQLMGHPQAPRAVEQMPIPANFPAMPPPSEQRRTTHDSKPRLSKEQHEFLESYFRMCNKPSTVVKRTVADQLGVPLEKINNWFQNRRAKVKQEQKKRYNQSNLLFDNRGAAQALGVVAMDSSYVDGSFYQTVDHAQLQHPPQTFVVHQEYPHVQPLSQEMLDQLHSGQPQLNSASYNFNHGDSSMVIDGDQNSQVFLMPQMETTYRENGSYQNGDDLMLFLGLDPVNGESAPSLGNLAAVGKEFNSQGEDFEQLVGPNAPFRSYDSSGSPSMLNRGDGDDTSFKTADTWTAFTSAATTNSRPSIADCRADYDGNYTYGAALRQTTSHGSISVYPGFIQQTIPDNAPNFDEIHPSNPGHPQGNDSHVAESSFLRGPEQFFRNWSVALSDLHSSVNEISNTQQEHQEVPTGTQSAASEPNSAVAKRKPAVIPARSSSFNHTSG